MGGGLALDIVLNLSSLVLLAALGVLCLLGAFQVWHFLQYIRLRGRGLATEVVLLARPLPQADRLPRVLVQVPTLNEGPAVGRMAQALAKLDWPRDRLHIQILDDSTDAACVEAAGDAVASLRSHGIDAALLHRSERTGFKGAAMQAGLERSTDEYVAVLDADYVPAPDFLRRLLSILIEDTSLGFVQARWDATNGDENALTRAQRRMIDFLFAIDAARGWSGHFVIFHGSGAIWRRAAIDDLGGWVSDILSEDLDISYRALLRGWSARTLETVPVPGELPMTWPTWMKQQYRWTGGVAEAMRKYVPLVLRSGLTVGQKLVASLHLVSSLFGTMVTIVAVAALVHIWLAGGVGLWAWTLAAIAIGETLIGVLGMGLMNQRLLRGANAWLELPEIVSVLAIFLCTQLAVAKSSLDAVLGKKVAWLPTPKQGGEASKAGVDIR